MFILHDSKCFTCKMDFCWTPIRPKNITLLKGCKIYDESSIEKTWYDIWFFVAGKGSIYLFNPFCNGYDMIWLSDIRGLDGRKRSGMPWAWARLCAPTLGFMVSFHGKLVGGNSNIFYFHPKNWGRWTHFDEHIFQRGWNHQLVESFHGDFAMPICWLKGMEILMTFGSLLGTITYPRIPFKGTFWVDDSRLSAAWPPPQPMGPPLWCAWWKF